MKRFLPLLAALSGCEGCQPEEDLPVVFDPIPTTATALWSGKAEGVGVVDLPVLTVNEVGAVVPGIEIAASSSVSLTSSTITPDAAGWGVAQVQSATVGAFDVSFSAGTLAATGTAFVTSHSALAAASAGWPAGDDSGPIAAAGGGVVVAEGPEAWWFGPDGSTTAGFGAAVRVLALTDDIVEMLPVNVDGDGVGDLVVWSGAEVVLLRGRAEGGATFQAGWTPRAGTVAGVYVGNLDEDASVDVLIVSNDNADATDGGASVAWMTSDGIGGWTPTAVLAVDYPVVGVSAEDFDGNGRAEITLITVDGILRRYDNSSSGWIAASTSDTTIGIGGDMRVQGGIDLTGDDAPDLAVAGESLEETGDASSVTSPGGVDTIVTYNLVSPASPQETVGVFVADGNFDGVPDLFLSTPTMFGFTRWSEEAGTFSVLNVGSSLPAMRRFSVADLDGDGLGDVLMPLAPARSVMGAQTDDDPETAEDESVVWRFATPYSSLFSLEWLGQPWAGDLDGDGIVDFVALSSSGGLSLASYRGVPEDSDGAGAQETLRGVDSVPLSATATALDLAVCDGEAWVLAEDAGVVLFRISLSPTGEMALVSSVTGLDGLHVACGEFAGAVAAVVDASGDVSWIADDGTVTVEELGAEGGDAVAGDTDGDGVSELHSCGQGCSLAIADLDGDGVDDLVESDGSTTTLTIAGVEDVLPWGGAVSTGDTDGDGVPDALIENDGLTVAVRGLGGRAGLPSVRFVNRAIRGAAIVGDLDGNGVPDLFLLGDERDPEDGTDWTGTMFYAESPDR